MSDTFDPYHKWLGIRDKHRPPNHYRLLGVEAFEDDVDVISAAADQRIAHVRTYQLGPHGALSQKILNELAAAKVCLLDPSRRAEYDRELRGTSFEPTHSALAQRAAGTDAIDKSPETPSADVTPKIAADIPLADPVAPTQVAPLPSLRPLANTASTAWRAVASTRRRQIPWSVVAGLAITTVIVLGIAIRFAPARGVTPDSADKSVPDQPSHFSPRSTTAAPSPSTTAQNPTTATESKSLSSADHLALTAHTSDRATATRPATDFSTGSGTGEPFRPIGIRSRWAILATDLPGRLRSSWALEGSGTSDVVLCYEIAQLAYANLALAALEQLPKKKTLESEITRAISKIDEFNVFGGAPFVELLSSDGTDTPIVQAVTGTSAKRTEAVPGQMTAKSWQEIDRCFDSYASAIRRLNAMFQDVPYEKQSPEKVTLHVEITEQLFHTVLTHVQLRLGELDSAAADGVNKLRTIESAATIDSFTAETAVQQICHWTLRICEALGVYCEYAWPDRANRLEQIMRQLSQNDFGSGLMQLRTLLLSELDLWAMLAEK